MSTATSARTGKGVRLLRWMGVAALVFAALVGSNVWSLRVRVFGSAVPVAAPAATSRDAFATVAGAPVVRTSLRSVAWWQSVTVLRGSGAQTPAPIAITGAAIQWRVRARCVTGSIVVRAAGTASPLIDAACPTSASGFSTRSGPARLRVAASGSWQLTLDQQIDAPLDLPPLPAMTGPGASVLARGRFYNVDQVGTGTATVYREASGAFALRLAHFFVTPTADLELWLTPHRHPASSASALGPGARRIALLQITAGSLNFPLPAGLDPSGFRSLVVWCALTDSAYAAATLTPPA